MGDFILSSTDYLDAILNILSGSFDLYRPVTVENKEYPAYGYFFSLSEKFLVTQKVNLWSARMYEHILFMQADECTEETLKEACHLIENHMEETYVRKGEKYPEKDHMVSYVTVCILSDKTPRADVLNAVKKYRYEKTYLFTFRGRSEGRLLCVDLSAENVYGNRSAQQVLDVYKKGFRAKEREGGGNV